MGLRRPGLCQVSARFGIPACIQRSIHQPVQPAGLQPHVLPLPLRVFLTNERFVQFEVQAVDARLSLAQQFVDVILRTMRNAQY